MITTSLGYHVIYRESSEEKPSLEDSRDEVLDTLANDSIEEDPSLQITAMDELRKEYGMTINDTELESDYRDYIAEQISYYKTNSSSN